MTFLLWSWLVILPSVGMATDTQDSLISIPVRGSPTYQATYDLSAVHDGHDLSYSIVLYTHTCANKLYSNWCHTSHIIVITKCRMWYSELYPLITIIIFSIFAKMEKFYHYKEWIKTLLTRSRHCGQSCSLLELYELQKTSCIVLLLLQLAIDTTRYANT